MKHPKEELIQEIESARRILNQSIDERRQYEEIYKNSVQLDALIEKYIGRHRIVSALSGDKHIQFAFVFRANIAAELATLSGRQFQTPQTEIF